MEKMEKVEKKGNNILVKNFPEVPRKMFIDKKVFDLLTPEEFKVHVYLMNVAEENFSPNIDWVQDFLQVSRGKAYNISKSLRMKGFLDMEKSIDGRTYIWFINALPINVKEHKEFLETKQDKLVQERVNRNLAKEQEIQRLTRLLELGDDDLDVTAVINEIERLESEKI